MNMCVGSPIPYVTVSQSAADFLGCLGKASAYQLPFSFNMSFDIGS